LNCREKREKETIIERGCFTWRGHLNEEGTRKEGEGGKEESE